MVFNMEEKNFEKNQEQKKELKSNLSIIALGLLLAKLFITFILSAILPKNAIINFLNNFPWIITSIILCIISRIKYKDKLSIIVLILDLIIIALTILIMAITLYFFATVANGCSNFLFETDFLNKMSACKDIG